jgi:hypothetical protein
LEWSIEGGNDFLGSPVIASDGTVLTGNEDGYLYAIWGSTPPATNSPWPMFQRDPQHTGTQPLPDVPGNDCGAPFLYNGTNDGTNFTFQIVGETNAVWNVYSSDDLSNWTQIAANLSLDIAPGSSDLSGTNTFTDSTVFGVAHRYYQLSTNDCCSRAIGFVNLDILPGTNLIANPFYQVDDNVLHTPTELFDFTPMNTLDALFLVSDRWGAAQAFTQVLEWNGQEFIGDINGGTEFPEWVNGGLMTLLPGTGALMVNVTSNSFPISFTGLIREEQFFQIENQTNYLSASAPLAGWITNVSSYAPHNGDIIQLFDPTNQISVAYPYSGGMWTSGTPFLAVGEGFVLLTTNQYTWTNKWERTVCAGP